MSNRQELWSDHWSTNAGFLNRVYRVFGEKFSDPCTSLESYYTLPPGTRENIDPIYGNDFLVDEYFGKRFSFMNSPYSKAVGGAGAFTDRMLEIMIGDPEDGCHPDNVHDRKNAPSATIILVNASTDTKWWSRLVAESHLSCFGEGRLKFDRVLDSRVLKLTARQRKEWDKMMSDRKFFDGYPGLSGIPKPDISTGDEDEVACIGDAQYVRDSGCQPRYANTIHLLIDWDRIDCDEGDEISQRFKTEFGKIGTVMP